MRKPYISPIIHRITAPNLTVCLRCAGQAHSDRMGRGCHCSRPEICPARTVFRIESKLVLS